MLCPDPRPFFIAARVLQTRTMFCTLLFSHQPVAIEVAIPDLVAIFDMQHVPDALLSPIGRAIPARCTVAICLLTLFNCPIAGTILVTRRVRIDRLAAGASCEQTRNERG
jgi:hypothetical protein